MSTDHLILYEGTKELRAKAIRYINDLTGSLKGIIDILVLLNRSDQTILKQINRVPLLNGYFTDEKIHSNTTLSILRSQFARSLGGKHYSTHVGHAIILFDLDIIQMDFLYNLKKNSELELHLFMKKSSYDDGNLNTNLKDYIDVMNFTIHK